MKPIVDLIYKKKLYFDTEDFVYISSLINDKLISFHNHFVCVDLINSLWNFYDNFKMRMI